METKARRQSTTSPVRRAELADIATYLAGLGSVPPKISAASISQCLKYP